MALYSRFFFVIFANVLIWASVPLRLAALSEAVIHSEISEMAALGDCLDYAVSLTIEPDWPEGSFCIFPEALDTREAFTFIAAYPYTHIFTANSGERIRVFEMRYRMRSVCLGRARIGGFALRLVNGESLETNSLTVPDSMVLIGEKSSRGFIMVLGFGTLGISLILLFLYKMRKRRK
ncbi:MAG: hypothetical protein LBC99_05100 [Spirochaetota bacterium]|jgi:hypothetical protein|nr:hypothetical protein [Spirochaetota bacterium]